MDSQNWTSLGANLRPPLAVALGAIAGALGRYYITLACVRWWGPGLPVATGLVNLVGAWAMGVWVARLEINPGVFSPELRLLVAVGFLGSFTTFSTYALDTVNLLGDRRLGLALAYGLGSVVLGVMSLYAGVLTVRFLR
jgi:CrcB protein